MKLLAPLFLGLVLSQGASAQTAILCTAQEQWTFAEEIGRPVNWAFNVEFEIHVQQISHFKVGGLRCAKLSKIYITEEDIRFTCTSEPTVFTVTISRLSGGFIILREFGGQSRLNGATIGNCQSGIRRF